MLGFGNDNLINVTKHLSLLESLNQNNKLISEYMGILIEQAEKHNSIDQINTYFKLGINAVIPNLIIEDGDIIIN